MDQNMFAHFPHLSFPFSSTPTFLCCFFFFSTSHLISDNNSYDNSHNNKNNNSYFLNVKHFLNVPRALVLVPFQISFEIVAVLFHCFQFIRKDVMEPILNFSFLVSSSWGRYPATSAVSICSYALHKGYSFVAENPIPQTRYVSKERSVFWLMVLVQDQGTHPVMVFLLVESRGSMGYYTMGERKYVRNLSQLTFKQTVKTNH